MYLDPSPGPLRFGDVIEADWLFDIYLRPDAAALEADQIVDDRIVSFTPRRQAPRKEPEPPRDVVAVHADFSDDWVLASGASRNAIVLTDDCELETLYGRTVAGEEVPRQARGRILFAAAKKATAGEIADVRKNASNFALPVHASAPKFAGRIVDLGRTFTVNTKSLLASPDYKKVVALDNDTKVGLSTRWDAYAARHGPLIAEQMTLTMAKLFDSDGVAARVAELRPRKALPNEPWSVMGSAVASALTSGWMLEGPIGDLMLTAWEEGKPVDDKLRIKAITALLSMRAGADAALSILGESAWKPDGATVQIDAVPGDTAGT
jgi:hypothetical protein